MDTMYKYVPVEITTNASRVIHGELEFDRNSLSYVCLKGCVYMQNKSTSEYVSVLARTLKEDYNIPLTIHHIGDGTLKDTFKKDERDWPDARELKKRIVERLKIECEALLADPICAQVSFCTSVILYVFGL